MEFCLIDRNKYVVKILFCGIFYCMIGIFDVVDWKCMIKGLNSVVGDLVKRKFSLKMVNVVEQVSIIYLQFDLKNVIIL